MRGRSTAGTAEYDLTHFTLRMIETSLRSHKFDYIAVRTNIFVKNATD